MTVKRGIFIVCTCQIVTAATNATIMYYVNLKPIARWVAVEGCKHVPYCLKVCIRVGKVFGDCAYNCSQLFTLRHGITLRLDIIKLF